MALDVNRAEKPVRKLRKLLKKMPAMPGADDIHDFRTSSRRIEATLQALSLDSGHNCRRILKQISRLRKRAGKVRDMDVLTDYLSSLPRHEKEKEYSVQLLRFAAEEPKGYSTRTADAAPIVRTAAFRNPVLRRGQERYGDFGPTLATEHLASDDGLVLHAETLLSLTTSN